jgi:hypothetical protein
VDEEDEEDEEEVEEEVDLSSGGGDGEGCEGRRGMGGSMSMEVGGEEKGV